MVQIPEGRSKRRVHPLAVTQSIMLSLPSLTPVPRSRGVACGKLSVQGPSRQKEATATRTTEESAQRQRDQTARQTDQSRGDDTCHDLFFFLFTSFAFHSAVHHLVSAAMLFSTTALLGLLTSYASATALTYKFNPNEHECFYAQVDEANAKVAFYFAVQSGGDFDSALS